MLIIKNEYRLYAIKVSKLSAVAIDDYLCTFYMENGEKVTCSKTLKEIHENLPPHFMRISRNCIVNVKKVKQIDTRKRKIELENGLSFSFSCRNAKKLKDKFIFTHQDLT